MCYFFFLLKVLSDCLTLCDTQIREKLTQLQEKREKINKKWQDKMDHLQIGTNHRITNHNSLFLMIVFISFMQGCFQGHGIPVRNNSTSETFAWTRCLPGKGDGWNSIWSLLVAVNHTMMNVFVQTCFMFIVCLDRKTFSPGQQFVIHPEMFYDIFIRLSTFG